MSDATFPESWPEDSLNHMPSRNYRRRQHDAARAQYGDGRTADRPATEPRTDHTTRYLYQCAGCWSYGLWAIPIGGGRSKTDEGWIECDCGEKMTRIDLRRQEPSPFAEAAQGAAPLTRDDRTNASLPPSAPDEVVRWMRNNDLVAVTRRAYDDVRWGAAPRAEGLDVERLRQSWMNLGYASSSDIPDDLAAEYARLSRPSDERVPEECKRFRHDEHCGHD